MQKGFKVNVDDFIKFVNTSSKTSFRAKVIKRLQGEKFVLEIIESDKPHFIGTTKEIDFAAPHNYSRIKILEVEPFENNLAKYEAAKHFNNCLLAVDTNDRNWFDDSYNQYILWNSKIKQEEGPNDGKFD